MENKAINVTKSVEITDVKTTKKVPEDLDSGNILNSIFDSATEERYSVSDIEKAAKEKYENDMKNHVLTDDEKKFDIDGDGKLNQAEQNAKNTYTKLKEEENLKTKFDINGDGKLDASEKAAMEKYKEAKKLDDVDKHFDYDGDGKLSKEEQAAKEYFANELLKKEIETGKKNRRRVCITNHWDPEFNPNAGMWDILPNSHHVFDINYDNNKDDIELETLDYYNSIHILTDEEKKFDKNGDGKLDSREIDAYIYDRNLKPYDKNGDYWLDNSEYHEMINAKTTNLNEVDQSFDFDQDGKLSEDEKKAKEFYTKKLLDKKLNGTKKTTENKPTDTIAKPKLSAEEITAKRKVLKEKLQQAKNKLLLSIRYSDEQIKEINKEINDAQKELDEFNKEYGTPIEDMVIKFSDVTPTTVINKPKFIQDK